MEPDDLAAVIEPRKGKREAALPPSALIAFTPLDVDLFLQRFPQSPPRKTHKLYLSDVYTATAEGVPLALTGPLLGAPQTVLVLERLIALGVRNVVALGWCGSLRPDVRIGDVVIPIDAVCEEGTSSHYPLPDGAPPVGPPPEWSCALAGSFEAEGLIVHQGRVWTTDAPFRETRGKVAAFGRQGVLGVEMETSALFTVARYRGIRLAVVLVVSDELHTLTWVHGFREKRFRTNRDIVADRTLKTFTALVSCSPFAEHSTRNLDEPR